MTIRLAEFNAFMLQLGYDSDTEVADFLGVPRSVIWKLRGQKQRPSTEFMALMKVKFPAVPMERFFAPEVGPR